ncbi:MAG: tRNA epoxyqueuosine(34) reductase QueG [Clostridiales bacterium]|nr:tRNA epoxyqueuosine(34) reductase QueG [Clostridiales bacterium]
MDVTRAFASFARSLGLLFAVAPARPLGSLRRALLLREERGWRASFEPPPEPRRWDPKAILPTAQRVVALALPAVPRRTREGRASPIPRGVVSRYAAGYDYHPLLQWRGEALALWLKAQGYESRFQVDTGPLSERSFAEAAGLGKVGKNGLLLIPGLGTWAFLGLLLTEAPLKVKPLVDPSWDPCGECDLCQRACPTDALRIAKEVDTSRCISHVTQERGVLQEAKASLLHSHIWGCDICQEVCPYSRGAVSLGRGPEMLFSPWYGLGRRPFLPTILRLTKGPFRRRAAHTPLNWGGLPLLKRNALYALRRKIPLSSLSRRLLREYAASDRPEWREAARVPRDGTEEP